MKAYIKIAVGLASLGLAVDAATPTMTILVTSPKPQASPWAKSAF